MAQPSHLRLQDSRAILQLVGECRELGDDRPAWRRHLIAGLAGLTDADLGFSGEMEGCRSLRPRDLGAVEWGWENGFDRAVFVAQMVRMNAEPAYYPAMNLYFARHAQQDGVCHTRPELIPDRSWYASHDYQSIHKAFGVDHVLWCFRALDRGSADVNSGLVLVRACGRRDYRPRDRLVVREAHAALAPLVGGALAGHDDPSPHALPSGARRILVCLLQGDCDKQIAARLKLSVHTVNGYTKAIYRHFGVAGRTELLARWIRRGWGDRFSWADTW